MSENVQAVKTPRDIVLEQQRIRIAKHQGREYVDLDDLRLWLTRSALASTSPTAKQVLKMIADKLGEK